MTNFKHLLVTGGCSFIGSNFVRHILEHCPGICVTVFDEMTYAARMENLQTNYRQCIRSLASGATA